MKFLKFVSVLFFIITIGCNKENKFPKVKKLSELKETTFSPTLENDINSKKNVIYSASLLFAWEEIRQELNDDIQVPDFSTDLKLFNTSTSFKNVLNDNEYTVNTSIEKDKITAKAEFSKSLSFETKLNSYDNRLTFNGKKVQSFGVSSYCESEQLKLVKILYYKNDDNLIIKLLPTEKEHEIILFKSDKKWDTMAEINTEIEKLIQVGTKEKESEKMAWKYYIKDEDVIIIPKLSFNLESNFPTLEGRGFNTNQQKYFIDKAWQRNAFIFNENGAELESEAEIEVCCEAAEEENDIQQPKKMIFNKPFFLMLKKNSSKNPYFCIWTNNTELMIEE